MTADENKVDNDKLTNWVKILLTKFKIYKENNFLNRIFFVLSCICAPFILDRNMNFSLIIKLERQLLKNVEFV